MIDTNYVKPRKRCSKCGGLKILEKFHKYKQSKDGYQSYCKDCQREYNLTIGEDYISKISKRY